MFRLSFLLLLLSCSLSAQDISFDKLQYYADITANAGLASSRQHGQDQFIKGLKQWLSSAAYSDKALHDLKYVSVKSPADSTFSIITWQLIDDKKAHSYYGFVRLASGKVIELKSENNVNTKDIVYESLDADNWYGALYYNLLPTKYNGKKAYLLFGYDGHKDFEHRKIVDVLYFENENPVFGAELFKKSTIGNREQLNTRLLIEYSKDANVSLNYNEGLQMITHDHLISRTGTLKGQGPTFVPDGSYVGYKWDGKYWNYIDKLYHQTSARPPSDGKKRSRKKRVTR